MLKTFKGDYRILRVVLSSKDPIEILHNFNTGKYSVITLLDMLEMLDVKETITEDSIKRQEARAKQRK